MLAVLAGAQVALDDLMVTAERTKDATIIRLAVAEAETISKVATRLAQAMSSWESDNPGAVRKNTAPRITQRSRQLLARLIEKMTPPTEALREARIDRHAAALAQGDENLYLRQQGDVLAPDGTTMPLRDWYEALSRVRPLTPEEQHDFRALS